MKILVVCPTAQEAAFIRRQTPDKKVKVISPPHNNSGRFDLVFVTDQYRREQQFATPEARERNERWFLECVATRLTGPDARIIHL